MPASDIPKSTTGASEAQGAGEIHRDDPLRARRIKPLGAHRLIVTGEIDDQIDAMRACVTMLHEPADKSQKSKR